MFDDKKPDKVKIANAIFYYWELDKRQEAKKPYNDS